MKTLQIKLKHLFVERFMCLYWIIVGWCFNRNFFARCIFLQGIKVLINELQEVGYFYIFFYHTIFINESFSWSFVIENCVFNPGNCFFIFFPGFKDDSAELLQYLINCCTVFWPEMILLKTLIDDGTWMHVF